MGWVKTAIVELIAKLPPSTSLHKGQTFTRAKLINSYAKKYGGVEVRLHHS
jgi:hypothetical protein